MESPIQPSVGYTQPRRRSSLQFERSQLERTSSGSSYDSLPQFLPLNIAKPPEASPTNNSSWKKWSPIALLLIASIGVAALTYVASTGSKDANVASFDSSHRSEQGLRKRVLTAQEEVSVDPAVTSLTAEEIDMLTNRDLKAAKNNKKKPKLNDGDLVVWQRFHTDLNGSKWKSCNSFGKPCDQGAKCKKMVKCKLIGDELRIVAINLPSNRLSGFVPARELNGLDKLKTINLSNKKKTAKKDLNDLRPAVPCLDMLRCAENGGLNCKFANTDILTGSTGYCSGDSVPGRDVHTNDLIIWQQFFSLTGGKTWDECADKFNNPCECQGAGNDVFVLCEYISDKLRITAVVLPENNLTGELAYSTQSLEGWTELRQLDLENNPKLKGCVGFKECVDDGEDVIRELACTVQGTQLSVCIEAGEDDGSIPNTTDQIRMHEDDQSAWEALYDNLNGKFWRYCSAARANPCAFPRCVSCEKDADEPLKHRITEIMLQDNGMSGELPLSLLFKLNDTLNYFDAYSSNSQDVQTRNIFTNTVSGCLELPDGWNLANSGLPLCEDEVNQALYSDADNEEDGLLEIADDTGSRRLESDELVFDSEDTYVDDSEEIVIEEAEWDKDDEQAQSLASYQMNQDVPLHPVDLEAYQQFYKSLHGETWIYCAESFSNPCGGCEEEQVNFDRVLCALETSKTRERFLRITEITLHNNHLIGVLDTEALNKMPKLSILDLSNVPFNTTNVFDSKNKFTLQDGKECIDLAVCVIEDTYCNFSGVNPKLRVCQ